MHRKYFQENTFALISIFFINSKQSITHHFLSELLSYEPYTIT